MEGVKAGLSSERYYESLQTFKTLLARKTTGPRKDQRAALDLVDQAFECCANASCAADVAGSVFGVFDAFHLPLTDNLLGLLLKFSNGIAKLPDGLNPSIAFLRETLKNIEKVGYGECSERIVDSIVRLLSERIFQRWVTAPNGAEEDLVESLALSGKTPDADLISQQLPVVASRRPQPETTRIFFSFFLRVVSAASANERYRGSVLRQAVGAVEAAMHSGTIERRFVAAYRALLALGRDERETVAQPFVGAFGSWLAQFGHASERLLARVLTQ